MMTTRALGLSFAGLAFVLAACGASDRDELASGAKPGASNTPGGATNGNGNQPAFNGGQPTGDAGTAATGACEKMDILFVVDNSGSMGEEQTNLATNFALVTSRLDALAGTGGKLDYRIAVTTTARTYEEKPFGLPIPFGGEKGDDGEFRRGCGMSHPWIERADNDRSKMLSCAAAVGTDGSSIEMPLDTMMLAVTDRVKDGKNAQFLRDDALLAVVILTDEDDCSTKSNDVKEECNAGELRPLADYLSTLDQVKNGRERWAAAVIAGETTCQSTFGSAAEASRLKTFVQQTGKNAVFSSICAGDLVQPLEAALAKFGQACEGFSVK